MSTTFEVGKTTAERAANRLVAELKQEVVSNRRANKALSKEIVNARRIVERFILACRQRHRRTSGLTRCQMCIEAEEYMTDHNTQEIPVRKQ